MNSEHARELFGAAYDGTLDSEQQTAFDGALAADPALRAAYDDYVAALRAVSGLDTQRVRTPDVLSGVQAKLHARSAGRYYRDRFSRKAPGPSSSWLVPVVVSAVVLGVLAVGWWVLLL